MSTEQIINNTSEQSKPVQTSPPADLEEHITEYIGKFKHRSPQTLDLYRRGIRACGLSTIRREDIEPTWTKLRVMLENEQVGKIFVDKSRTVIRGVMRAKAWKFERTEDYQRIIDLCGVEGEDIEEYTERDIDTILAVTYNDTDLFNHCVLQSLSGIRAGASKGLRWSDFHKVEGVDGVMIYRVVSKGKPYIAAISEKAYNFMLKRNTMNSPYLVWYDEGFATDFTRLMRSRLYYLLVTKHQLREALELDRKSLQHSMRHFALTEFAAALEENDASILSGHKVSYGTINRYVNKRIERNGGLPLPEYQRKIGELYKQTPVFNYDLEKIVKQSGAWRY